MQTIRRDVDALCEGDMLHRVHGRIELSEEFLNTPFDQRAGTNLLGKRAIGESAASLIHDGATLFISIGSTPLSVAQALRRRKGLTVITNNLSAAMALSEEVSNRIMLPGGELRLPDRDILGDEVLPTTEGCWSFTGQRSARHKGFARMRKLRCWWWTGQNLDAPLLFWAGILPTSTRSLSTARRRQALFRS